MYIMVGALQDAGLWYTSGVHFDYITRFLYYSNLIYALVSSDGGGRTRLTGLVHRSVVFEY